MLEIVNDVLKAEKEAEERVLEAREKQQHELSSYENEERQRLEQARREAADRVALEISRIRKEAEEESGRREEAIHKKADLFLDEHSRELAEVALEVKKLLIETPSVHRA